MQLLKGDLEFVSKNGEKDLGVTRVVQWTELAEGLELKAKEDGHVVEGTDISGLLEHLEK